MVTTIASLSIGYDRRVSIPTGANKYTAGAFPYLRADTKERIEDMEVCIEDLEKNDKVDIFSLQEIPLDLVSVYEEFFQKKGYTVCINSYAEDDGAFRFLTAFRPEKIKCLERKQLYFTLTGLDETRNREAIYNRGGMKALIGALENKRAEWEKSDEAKEIFKKGGMEAVRYVNLGSDWGKSAQCFVFEDAGKKFIFVNNHFGLTEEQRMLMAEILCTEYADLELPIIFGGDFNQWDPKSKVPAVSATLKRVFERKGFSSSGENIPFSFVCFPHDIHHLMSEEDFERLKQIKASAPNPGPADYKRIEEFYLKTIKEKNLQLQQTRYDDFYVKNIPEHKVSVKTVLFLDSKRIEPQISGEELNKTLLFGYEKHKCLISADHLPLVGHFDLTDDLPPESKRPKC